MYLSISLSFKIAFFVFVFCVEIYTQILSWIICFTALVHLYISDISTVSDMYLEKKERICFPIL